MENMWITAGSGFGKLQDIRSKYASKSKKALWAIAQAKDPPMFEIGAYDEMTRTDIMAELVDRDLYSR